jgi:hypothetical protein
MTFYSGKVKINPQVIVILAFALSIFLPTPNAEKSPAITTPVGVKAIIFRIYLNSPICSKKSIFNQILKFLKSVQYSQMKFLLLLIRKKNIKIKK